MKNKKDLIAQISENLAVTPPPAAARSSSGKTQSRFANRLSVEKTDASIAPLPPARRDTETPPLTNTGKPAAFWLDDEDRAIFHETGMLLYSQGIKPSFNLVLRAAIRMIPRDHRLVEKVRELIEKDGRKVRHQRK